MSFSAPDPRWTPQDRDHTVAAGPLVPGDGGGPILPLLRRGLVDEPVDHDELLDHVVTAIHDIRPVHNPRPELLALLDLPDVTPADLDQEAALTRVDLLREAPEDHAELIGAVALAVSAIRAAAMAAPTHDLGPEIIGLVCAALRTPPAVRSAKEAYQHARAARNALTAELPDFVATAREAATTVDTELEEPAIRVLLRTYVLRRWLLETSWPQRRVCWRVLDKVAAATLPPADPSTLERLTGRLTEFQFRRWPS